MATIRLTWTDPNSGAAQEDEFRVYRSTAVFDAGSLPAVLATLPADTVTYDDTTASDGVTYYYAVMAVRGAAEALSEVIAFVPAETAFFLTIPAGVLDDDVLAFPVRINLALMPESFWDDVATTDGGDIRVFDGAGTRVPAYIPKIDTTAKTGYCIALIDIAAATDTDVEVRPLNDAGMSPPAASDTYGQNAVWASYAAAYLLDGDLTDETGNGRDLTWNSGSPTYSGETQYGIGGGINTTAAAGYGSHVDAALDGLPFTIFGIAERTVENTSNQTFIGMVDTLGSATDRQLLGQRNSTENWTFFSQAASWKESGVVCALDTPASMGVRADDDGGDDTYYCLNGEEYLTDLTGHLSDKTLLVGTGRGVSNSDWRGHVYIALFQVGSSKSASWSRAEHMNWFTSGGLFSPDVTEAWVGPI